MTPAPSPDQMAGQRIIDLSPHEVRTMVDADYRAGVVDELRRLDLMFRSVSKGIKRIHTDISNHMATMTQHATEQDALVTRLRWSAVGLGITLIGALLTLIIERLPK